MVQGPVTQDFWKSYSIRPRYSTFKHFRACSARDEDHSAYAQPAMKARAFYKTKLLATSWFAQFGWWLGIIPVSKNNEPYFLQRSVSEYPLYFRNYCYYGTQNGLQSFFVQRPSWRWLTRCPILNGVPFVPLCWEMSKTLLGWSMVNSVPPPTLEGGGGVS